jgi:hypothetical protein
MKVQNKNKIQMIFLIIVCLFFTIASIHAITNYFTKQKKEKIKLMNSSNIPIFTVERTAGNNADKTLIPMPMPNLDQQKYDHLITFDHEATLNLNGMVTSKPLFLKLKTIFDTNNTFVNPEKYFNLGVNILDNNNQKNPYDDTSRPQMKINNGIGKIKIQMNIEQKDFITTNNNPQLDLICNYELVDAQGNSYSGGSQTITNTITNTA